MYGVFSVMKKIKKSIKGHALTEREILVLILWAREFSLEEIGVETGLSWHSAGSDLRLIYLKLDAHTRLGVVNKAWIHDILTKEHFLPGKKDGDGKEK